MSAEFLLMEDIELDVIKDKPWASELHKECLDLCSKIFLKGLRVIQDIDSSEEFTKTNLKTFSECLQTKMNVAASHLNTMYQHHLDKIGSLLDKVIDLEKKLEITPSIAEQDFTTKSLVEFEGILKTTVDKYQQLLDEQNNLLAELQRKHAFYVYKLGKSPKRLSLVQSKTEDFRCQIQKLEQDVTNRQERYEVIKKKIEEIDKETKIVPIEKWAKFCGDSIIVSDEMMVKLKEFYKETICLRAQLNEEIDTLNENLEKLWILLEIPSEEQKIFIDTLDGYSKSSKQKFQSEVEKLTKMRKEKLPEIIEKQKSQIQYWWDCCHCDWNAKSSFPFIYSTDYNEELYNNCRNEITKWERYYEEHREILEQLEEYKNLKNNLLEINLSMEGSELYQNRRGGVLLSVLKKKNIITSRLATAEKKLLTSSKNYFKSNNKTFLTSGMTIENFLAIGKERHGSSQKLTIAKAQSLMKTSQMPFSKHKVSKNPSSVDSRLAKATSTSKTRTPNLPKFKLNQGKTKSSPSSSHWKPSNVRSTQSKKSDGEDSWTDHSDLEKQVKHIPRRNSFCGEKK